MGEDKRDDRSEFDSDEEEERRAELEAEIKAEKARANGVLGKKQK